MKGALTLPKEELKKKDVLPNGWKLGKCYGCGNIIMVKDDYTPASCPICRRSRVD